MSLNPHLHQQHQCYAFVIIFLGGLNVARYVRKSTQWYRSNRGYHQVKADCYLFDIYKMCASKQSVFHVKEWCCWKHCDKHAMWWMPSLPVTNLPSCTISLFLSTLHFCRNECLNKKVLGYEKKNMFFSAISQGVA